MSDTNDIEKLMQNLQRLSIREKRYCVTLYLSRTNCSFFVPIKTNRNFFYRTIKMNTNYHLPGKFILHFKYTIFVEILVCIKQMNGTVNSKIKLQLLSDCTSNKEINEFGYHLYKTPPPECFIIEILSEYKRRFNDSFFEDTVAKLSQEQQQNTISIVQKEKSLQGNPIFYVFSCNKEKNLFYVRRTSLPSDSDGDVKVVSVSNSINRNEILKALRLYVNTNFNVNSEKNSKDKIGLFILPRGVEALGVEVYNDFIVNVHRK